MACRAAAPDDDTLVPCGPIIRMASSASQMSPLRHGSDVPLTVAIDPHHPRRSIARRVRPCRAIAAHGILTIRPASEVLFCRRCPCCLT